MPRANAVYIDRLRGCVIAALRDFNLPAMIPTREILSQTQPRWGLEPMSEFVSLNEVVIGRMMGRLGYAQVHGPMFNGWWVERA
jgi:hypothetical protein